MKVKYFQQADCFGDEPKDFFKGCKDILRSRIH